MFNALHERVPFYCRVYPEGEMEPMEGKRDQGKVEKNVRKSQGLKRGLGEYKYCVLVCIAMSVVLTSYSMNNSSHWLLF